MLYGRFCVIAICLTGALAAAAVLSPAPLSAQEVQLILGSGFSPDDLRMGSRPSTSRISADADTIVVLMRTWPIEGGDCEDWVILRGGWYQIKTSIPSTCRKSGHGDELEQAMNGKSMVTRLMAPKIFSGDPRSDDANPIELQRLYSNLEELREMAERQARHRRWVEIQERAKPPTRHRCLLSGRVVHTARQRPLANVAINLYSSLRNHRPQRLKPNVATTDREGEFTIDCSSIADSSFPLAFGLDRDDWKSMYIIGPEIERKGTRTGLVLKVKAESASKPTPTRSLKPSQIQARYKSSQCLHRKYNNWDNGNPIHLWSCAAGSDAMKVWGYDLQTGYIRSIANPRMCWHRKLNNWNNGNPIHLWSCSAGLAANKTWTYDAKSGLIRARGNPRKCIHKKEGGFSNGNPVHLWDCGAGRPEFKSWSLR